MTHASSYSNGTKEITQPAPDIFLSPEEPSHKLLGWDGLGRIPYKYANSYFFSFHKALKFLVKALKQIKKQKSIFRNSFCIVGNGKTSTNVKQFSKLYTKS